MPIKKILIHDPTLRDGNHALGHQLTLGQVATYCKAVDLAKIPVVEVGHGNGLGASSIQVGLSRETDHALLETARKYLSFSKLSVHVIPGFATIKRDLASAIEIGVDVFRVASHCTEADITQKHITYLRNKDKTVYGVLMMSHMASIETLVSESLKMQSYGAEGLVIMDSAGTYLPSDVKARISALVAALQIPVGFHGHNNLGMGVANSLIAVEYGATILDACSRGFGAGAGNTQLEVLIAVLEKQGYCTGVDLYKILEASDIAERDIIPVIPVIQSTSIVSGMAGVFSGFLKPVERIAKQYHVDAKDIFFALGKRGVVAGQEDLIVEIALQLLANQKKLKEPSHAD